MSGKYVSASAKLSVPWERCWSSCWLSSVICSSKSECSTTAPAHATSIRRMLSRDSESGPAEATRGLRSVRPRYEVERSIMAGLRRGSVRRRGRPLLVDAPARPHVLLGLPEQPPRSVGIAVSQHRVARLVVGVLLEVHARRLGVQLHRVLPVPRELGVVAEERPVAGEDGGLLLVHAVAQVVAVRDAVAVGDDERRPRVGLRLAEGLERVGVVAA